MAHSDRRAIYDYGTRIGARFARSLQQEREAAGLTKYGLARESGISREHIARLERGEANPTLVVAAQLSRALRMSFAEFACRMEGRDEDAGAPGGNVPDM